MTTRSQRNLRPSPNRRVKKCLREKKKRGLKKLQPRRKANPKKPEDNKS
jgi:hypothetical protein